MNYFFVNFFFDRMADLVFGGNNDIIKNTFTGRGGVVLKTKYPKRLYWTMIIGIFFLIFMESSVLGANDSVFSGKTANMAYAYAAITGIALLLAVGYGALVKRKELWLLLLFVSVVIVNFGYFSISVSKTLEEALLANRISYLGSVFLPLCMLMTIIDVCRLRYRKWFLGLLLLCSILVFLLAASPGYLDWYYKDVILVHINGMAMLEKEYGPLHVVYFVYLVVYFSIMLGAIFVSMRRKQAVSHKHAAILVIIVFLNIAIWFIEQKIYWHFEFLSISYIISELLLLMLYGMMQDYGILADYASTISEVGREATDFNLKEAKSDEHLHDTETTAKEELAVGLPADRIAVILKNWSAVEMLTKREKDVLSSLLENKKRKDIAEDLHVTEHTIKKHTANIFSKLDVTCRAELLEKAEKETWMGK